MRNDASPSDRAAHLAWAEEALGGSLPNERAASCGDCVMCPPEGVEASSEQEYFDPLVRCCSYHPTLPSFLVGWILSSPTDVRSTGRARVLERIESGASVSPLGLERPPRTMLLAQHGEQGFGRSTSLLCPYYDSQDELCCSIWPYRNHVCATYFCKHDRGTRGERFWTCCRQLLAEVEHAVSLHCALVLGLTDAALEAVARPRSTPASLSAAELDGVADPRDGHALWGPWRGREVEYFQACGELARKMSWQDVLAAGGSRLEAARRLARAAYRDVTESVLPQAIRVQPFTARPLPGGQVRVATTNTYDALELPLAVLQALPFFDGRPTAEALKSIAEELDTEIDEELLLLLLDFEILVAASEWKRA